MKNLLQGEFQGQSAAGFRKHVELTALCLLSSFLLTLGVPFSLIAMASSATQFM